MYGARPISEAEAPRLYAIVRRLATRAQIPMPPVYLIPTDAPNAFATGRSPDHAAVAVTEGIMRILDEDELEGVLAHELRSEEHTSELQSRGHLVCRLLLEKKKKNKIKKTNNRDKLTYIHNTWQ